MKRLCLSLLAVLAVACSTTPGVENKGKDQEIQILPPNIRVEKYKETFNMKAEGPVTTDCGGKPCTPEQLDGLKPDQIKKFKKNGAWKEYQEKEDSATKKKISVLIRTGEYKDDKREGSWKTLYETGEVLRDTPYVGGVKEGEEKKFKRDGVQTESTTYKADKKHGPYWKKNNEGLMDEEGSYKDDQKDGLWTEYYAEPGQNGAKKKVSNYSNGQKQGAETSYHKDGSTVQSEGSYKDDLKTGIWKTYYDNGSIQMEGGYKPKLEPGTEKEKDPKEKKALRSGYWKEYYKNGNVFAEGQREHTRKGVWKFNWSNGNPAYKGEMMNEFMMSSAEAYNKEGQLIGKGKLQFSIMNIDEATNELKASYKPDIPFTYYKNGNKQFEIVSDAKAIEYDDNGSKIGEGPIMVGTNKKNGCWTVGSGKVYYINGNENKRMGEMQGCK
ncbi:LIC20035 family adhesin [Leptospira yasudae]|uniref:LIC20035 family adhesin n=1 Tax=Leptospira yasudae TaxID=2202201 RepID=A0ABX9M1F3_9LEPT|nr:LIC20035 family adhesin [Leptospira yasudae]RHX78797.1 LIC20035 family adhesin [Leptospira yasudae]RHX91674.1 LIC20035 family adhesin [Leptospira yasudae]TGK27617.1 LIC20035 family adhesin [Leptospira yasudae]TGM06741.1 LIC20035 family adhesin [Leptospira yasudae]